MLESDVLSGVGLGWRPELEEHFCGSAGPCFVEVVAESMSGPRLTHEGLLKLIHRGTPVIAHGVSLGIGDPGGLDMKRVDALARTAERLGAPIVSEHVAFVRAGKAEIGHLTPVPRCDEMLEVLIERINQVCQVMPVPFALENIATLFEWPENEIDEATFITTLIEETPAKLLLDVSNVYANALNHDHDAWTMLRRYPLDEVAYVHVAGGTRRGDLYHDTHAHPLPATVLSLVRQLAQASPPTVPVLLERDDRFPSFDELDAELRSLRVALNVNGDSRTSKVSAPRVRHTSRRPNTEPSDISGRMHALAGALVDSASPPHGFDAERLQVARQGLASKRQRSVLRCQRRTAEARARATSLNAMGELLGSSWLQRTRRSLASWIDERRAS